MQWIWQINLFLFVVSKDDIATQNSEPFEKACNRLKNILQCYLVSDQECQLDKAVASKMNQQPY